MNLIDDVKSASKSYSDVFPAPITCPCCNQYMTYVGDKPLDMAEAFKTATEQHWERVEKMSNIERASKAPIPEGYKCLFCGVMPLSTSHATWRLPFGHFSEADHKNAQLREEILKRDDYTCCDCSLKLPRHMEVRHLDEDHTNNDPSNLVCVCPFCHMRDHLGPTGFAMAATVIGSTRIPQALINVQVLVCWYILSRIQDTEDIRDLKESETDDAKIRLLKAARYLLSDLQTAGSRWVDSLSKAATDPYTFGTLLTKLRYEEVELLSSDKPNAKPTYEVKKVLHDSKDSTQMYKDRAVTFSALSLLPRQEAFKRQCQDWFAYFDAKKSIDSWAKGMEVFLKRHELDDVAQLCQLIKEWNKVAIQEHSGNPTLPKKPRSLVQENQTETQSESRADIEPAAKKNLASAAPAVAAVAVTTQAVTTSQPPAETEALAVAQLKVPEASTPEQAAAQPQQTPPSSITAETTNEAVEDLVTENQPQNVAEAAVDFSEETTGSVQTEPEVASEAATDVQQQAPILDALPQEQDTVVVQETPTQEATASTVNTDDLHDPFAPLSATVAQEVAASASPDSSDDLDDPFAQLDSTTTQASTTTETESLDADLHDPFASLSTAGERQASESAEKGGSDDLNDPFAQLDSSTFQASPETIEKNTEQDLHDPFAQLQGSDHLAPSTGAQEDAAAWAAFNSSSESSSDPDEDFYDDDLNALQPPQDTLSEDDQDDDDGIAGMPTA